MRTHARQFLLGKALTTTWPSARQIDDWTQVLLALRARLLNQDLPDEAPHGGQTPALMAEAGADANVGECVAALEETRHALQRETAQRQELERAFQGIQKALVQAESDLACVRGGERQARHLALHDELTALPNRRHLLQELDQALAQRSPMRPGPTVIYIDLDHFKSVNDTHGHGVGDEVLCITAARLTAAVRQGDLVVRLGGDEFACLLHGVSDTAPLRQLCAKLLHAVSLPMKVADLQLLVCPSIGIAMCPQDGAVAAKDLLACADAAMYAAKRDRRGFTFYDEVG
ncbi:MAG: GGDEF domain-containing protein [Acidovorax sp.]|nr:MAG: GGDEF domain-containing protein [Acidovorax sp.]